MVKRFPDGVRDGVGPWGGGGRALCQGGGDLISGESGAVCKGAEEGGEGSSSLRRKKVVEQGVVDLGRGGGIREGWEARGKSSQRQLFYSPYTPQGGRSKEGHPVGCLGGFDGFEVAFLREVGGCTVGRAVGGVGLP